MSALPVAAARHCAQHTLAAAVSLTGIGLHRGQQQHMRLLPATAHQGIAFVRSDLPGAPRIAASIDNVVDTRLCTTLACASAPQARVQTVEHLLSALWSLGIDNADVELDGAEVPVLDGSARPIVQAIASVGRRRQTPARSLLYVTRPIEVRTGDKVARLSPPRAGRRSLRVSCALQFAHPLIPTGTFVDQHSAAAFRQHLAAARTFGFVRDVQALRQHGLALGGSLDNAVVFDADSVRNEGGLRYVDECARHKVLDALGDLSLLGAALAGELTLICSGHALHVALGQALAAAGPHVVRVPADAQLPGAAVASQLRSQRSPHGFAQGSV